MYTLKTTCHHFCSLMRAFNPRPQMCQPNESVRCLPTIALHVAMRNGQAFDFNSSFRPDMNCAPIQFICSSVRVIVVNVTSSTRGVAKPCTRGCVRTCTQHVAQHVVQLSKVCRQLVSNVANASLSSNVSAANMKTTTNLGDACPPQWMLCTGSYSNHNATWTSQNQSAIASPFQTFLHT
jgi:hypothetical protein